MGYEMIELTKDGGVATIKLDRPKALNALCGPMMAEVADALAALETDDAIGCVIPHRVRKSLCRRRRYKRDVRLGLSRHL